jgi:hypothetical protein
MSQFRQRNGPLDPGDPRVTQKTPLRLDIACQFAFPDGSVSASALRRMVTAGKVEAELIAGKYYVTLAAIEEMRKQCRVKVRGHTSNSNNTPMGENCGSSVTTEDNAPKALAAMNATATALIENLRPSSSNNMTRQKPSTRIIPIKPK